MAVTSTPASAYICRRIFPSPPLSPSSLKGSSFSESITFATKPRGLCIRTSISDASADATATEIETEPEPESPVEASKGAPSLISALNAEKAIRGIAITDADHYGRLGIQKGCSYDQVTVAYKKKVDELMNQESDDEEITKKLELLKESHSTLSSVQDRRLYDWSLARSGKPDRYLWPFEVDITQTTTDSPPPQEPEDVGPTRMVGYFILGWMILAFTLSIALNR